MNTRYRLSNHAQTDIDTIWLSIAEQNVNAADQLLDRMLEIFILLGRQRMIGRNRDDLGDGLRSVAVSPYVVVYRFREDVVEIVRVWHGARNY
jgi:toxin ParE1/3/4